MNYEISFTSGVGHYLFFLLHFFSSGIGYSLFHFALQVLVILCSLGLLSGGVYGTMKLEQDSDPSWFVASDSYLTHYFKAEDKYFPTTGENAAVYLGRVNVIKTYLTFHIYTVCTSVYFLF